MTEQPTAPPGGGDRPQGAADGLRALRRSRDERMLAGVLGGLGQRLGIDPVLLRIVTVVLAVFGGVGIVVYAAGWLLIPDEGSDRSVADQALGRGDDRPEPATLWLAGGLVLAVLIAAGATFGSGVGTVLLVLAAAGVIVLLRRDALGGDTAAERFSAEHEPHSVEPSAGGAGEAAETPAAAPADEPSSVEASADAEPADRPEYVHSFTATPASAWPDPPDWPASDTDRLGFESHEQRAEQHRPSRSHLGGLTLSAAAVALGVLAIVDAAGASIPASAYVALALAIIGVGLLIGSWFGRARGLIAWGLIAMLLALPATAVGDILDWDLTGEDRTITISEVAAVPDEPRSHGMGRVVYDLGELDLADTDDLTLDISQSVGALQVIVPQDADVTVNAATGMGHIDAFTEQAGGHQNIQVIDLGADGEGGGALTLDLDLGLGQIMVSRVIDVPAVDVPAVDTDQQRAAR